MRILQVTPAFYPAEGHGGAPYVVYEISKRLSERGHEVTVYTTDANDKYSRLNNGIKNIDGVNVYYFKNISNSLAYEHKLFISPGMVSAMKEGINNFDIIHLHDFRTLQNIMAHHYTKKYGVPYILQAHGSVPRIIKKQGLKNVFDFFFGYGILRDASKLIALTKMEVEQYKNMGVSEDKIVISPNTIDLSDYKDLPQCGAFKRKYGIENHEQIILFLSRIHKMKGPDLLVSAFSELSKELQGVKLIIAGPDDGYLPIVNKLVASLGISDKVLVTGHLSQSDKMKAYVDSDVYVLPSFYEPFGMTLLEACACGTPVVVTDRNVMADWVSDSDAGIVVQFDKNQLKEALIKLLTNDELRKHFGGNARKLIEGIPDWDVATNIMEQLYYHTILNEEKSEEKKAGDVV